MARFSPRPPNRPLWAWAFYDWANSAFATVVMAGFFPLFFKEYWATGLEVTESTYQLGMINAFASLVVVLLSPLLGATADQLGQRRGFLLIFAALGALATGGLYWVERGAWELAALLYVAGVVGFSGANLFYDALLTVVSPADQMDRVSALGYGLGYLGGGLLFAFNVWLTLSPATFGLADASEAVRIAFLLTALWWLLFSVPLALWVRDPNPTRALGLAGVRAGLRQLVETLGKVRALPHTFTFLLAYWLYIDGVDTIIRMAVDYGLAMGLAASDLILALLITQFVGFPSALLFGRVGERLGSKQGILLAIGVYILVTLYSLALREAWQFYLLAVTIGLVQGGVQALSRSLFARLVPAGHSAEFFGFYNMLGKFAAVIGPLLMGGVTLLTGSNQLGILSVVVLFIGGALLLWRVDPQAGAEAAAGFTRAQRLPSARA